MGFAFLLENIDFGEGSFTTGTADNTVYNNEIFKLAYSYSLIHAKQYEFAIGAGLHVTTTELSLDAPNVNQNERADGTEPLPVFGFRGRFELMPKLSLRGKSEHFILNADNYQGVFTDFLLVLEHQTLENVGFGIGYNRANFDLESDDGNLRGELENSYSGWLLYTNLKF